MKHMKLVKCDNRNDVNLASVIAMSDNDDLDCALADYDKPNETNTAPYLF